MNKLFKIMFDYHTFLQHYKTKIIINKTAIKNKIRDASAFIKYFLTDIISVALAAE